MTERHDPLSSGPDLPRVGAPAASVPAGPAASGQDGGRWASTAEQQLRALRAPPVVGRLPWRAQYIALAGVLMISLLVLMGSLASRPAGALSDSQRAAAARVRGLALAASTGEPVDAKALDQAAQALGTTGPDGWQDLSRAATAWAVVEQQWAPVAASARAASQALEQGRAKVQAAWPAIRNDGMLALPEAVDLARLAGAYGTLSAKLSTLASGHSLAAPLETEMALSKSAFDAFKGSALVSRRNIALTRAWLDASAAWGAATPALSSLDEGAGSTSQARRQQALSAVHQADAAVLAHAPANAGHGALALAAGLVAFLALGMLLVVAWKQHQRQSLMLRALVEQTDAAVVGLSQDLGLVEQGDLTRHVHVPDSALGAAAVAMNRTIDGLRTLVAASRQAAGDATRAATHAGEAAGALVDRQRERLAGLETDSQDILRLVETVGTGASQAQASRLLAVAAQDAAQAGQASALDSLDRMREIRDRVEEASNRTQRLVASSNEIAGMALMLKEIAEQLEILGMQAALQASKAGESGQGFRVVARQVQELSEDSGARARHVSALVDTALSDLETLLSSMRGAAASVEEGSRLTDLTHEAWGQVDAHLKGLADRIGAMHDNSQAQERLAGVLDGRTRHELEQMDPDAQRTQEASEAFLGLGERLRSLDQSLSRLKA